MSRRGDSRNVWLAVALGLGMVASAEWAFAGPPPIRNPAGMRNPAGPSPRNPAGPPPLDPTGSFSHLRPISPPGGDSIVERGRPHGGGGNSHHGHHGSWQAGYGGYPSWGGGVTVFGSPFNDAGAFPFLGTSQISDDGLDDTIAHSVDGATYFGDHPAGNDPFFDPLLHLCGGHRTDNAPSD